MYYPEANFWLAPQPSQPSSLTIQASVVPTADELIPVIADLARDRSVSMGIRGRLSHNPAACHDEMHEIGVLLKLPRRSWLLELCYPLLPGGRHPVHPKMRIRAPMLPSSVWETHPHTHRANGTRGYADYWACPLPPHETEWSWTNGGTPGYLDQACIWLFKTEVWLATGGQARVPGTWLGDDATHDPARVLASIPPGAPCRCGRGIEYGRCHREVDERDLLRTTRPRVLTR